MAGQLNYSRMPGFGDLSGDSRHPNSPDYVEPAFDLSDADAYIAGMLVKADEVSELVMQVRESLALLDWIARNTDLPPYLLTDFRTLDRRARELAKSAEAFLGARS